MTLHEALRSIPGDTLLRSHLDRSEKTAEQLLKSTSDESGYAVSHNTRNYGRDKYVTIYAVGIGVLYSQV